MSAQYLRAVTPFLTGALLWSAIGAGALPNYRLGFARIGANSVDTDPAFERNLLRSFENLSNGNVTVASLSDAVGPESLALENNRVRLRDAMASLAQYLRHPELTTKEAGRARLEEVSSLRRSVAVVPEWGPLAQEAIVLEMAAHWKLRETDALREKVKLALQIFPEIDFEPFERRDLDTLEFQQILFQEEVRKGAMLHRPICQVQIPKEDRAEKLRLNGFALPDKKNIQLYAGTRAQISAYLEDKQVQSKELHCERQQYLTFVWQPVDKALPGMAGLADLGRKADLKSLILWDTRTTDLKLFLYTPGVGLDEIPLTKQARVADLSSYRESPVPVASDAFQALLAKHQGASGQIETNLSGGTPWYNDWRVWTGVAVVSAVVVGALVLTGSSNKVESRPAGLSIRFP